MRFIVDQNLPPALAAWLRNHGEDAVHVREIGLREGSDRQIAIEALARAAVVITKDSDYSEGMPVPVVWLRIGNATNPVLFALLDRRWEFIRRALEGGEWVVSVEDGSD